MKTKNKILIGAIAAVFVSVLLLIFTMAVPTRIVIPRNNFDSKVNEILSDPYLDTRYECKVRTVSHLLERDPYREEFPSGIKYLILDLSGANTFDHPSDIISMDSVFVTCIGESEFDSQNARDTFSPRAHLGIIIDLRPTGGSHSTAVLSVEDTLDYLFIRTTRGNDGIRCYITSQWTIINIYIDFKGGSDTIQASYDRTNYNITAVADAGTTVDTIYTGSGNDTIVETPTGRRNQDNSIALINSGAGNDFISATSCSNAMIFAQAGNDNITVHPRCIQIRTGQIDAMGGPGRDTVNGSVCPLDRAKAIAKAMANLPNRSSARNARGY